MDVTDADVWRSALFNALASGITLEEVCELARHADCADCFDDAVALYTIGAIDPKDYRFEWVYR